MKIYEPAVLFSSLEREQRLREAAIAAATAGDDELGYERLLTKMMAADEQRLTVVETAAEYDSITQAAVDGGDLEGLNRVCRVW